MSSLVSVCIPVYNGEQFIRKTIQMVLHQNYDNMEILISDNASTDNTVREIKKIQDKRIRLLQNETNVGMAGNWNSLLEHAKGDYVIIVCVDDFLFPGAIEEKAGVLDKYPDVNIVSSASFVMSEKGKRIMKRCPFTHSRKFDGKVMQQELFVKGNLFAEPTNNMLRRSAILRTGRFDGTLEYTIDWDYWIRILKEGNAYYIDKPYSGFRISTSSCTGSYFSGKENVKEKFFRDERAFLDKYKNGDIIPITQEMLEHRNRNIRKRLNQKILFMKIVTLLSKISRRG